MVQDVTTQASALRDAFFFAAEDGTPLFGFWRAPHLEAGSIERVCVFVPPFGEEEKCARRVIGGVLDAWCADGIASLLFALRGTGDSGGTFAQATLGEWHTDIKAACTEARRRAPRAALCLLGLRLGAALALQLADEVGADSLVLLEPNLDGKRYLSQMESRQRLRAQMMKAEGGAEAGEVLPVLSDQSLTDLDGWALSTTLREELKALNVSAPTRFSGVSCVVQISPRAEITPPLRAVADGLGAQARSVVMPAFWNANDETDPTPLLDALPASLLSSAVRGDRSGTVDAAAAPQSSTNGEEPFLLRNAAGQQFCGVWHPAQSKTVDTELPIVVMLHGWSGYRIGPHQMLTRAARELAAEGYPCARFDFAGRGDSEGVTSHATLATMREDLRAVLAWCRERQGQNARFVLLGICAGCEIAFAGAGEEGLAGLALWSAPVFAAGESEARVAKRRAHFLREYARKLTRLETYRKLLMGRIDTKGVGKALGGRNAGELKNAEGDVPGQLPTGWKARRVEGFKKAARPTLLVYGTADPTASEAEAYYRARCAEARVTPQVHHVAGANHSYYGLVWEQEVFEATRVWLKTL